MTALPPDLEALGGTPDVQREVDALRRPPPRGRGPTPHGRRAREAAIAAAGSLPPIEPLTARIQRRLLQRWPAFGETAALEQQLRRAIHANLAQYFERVIPGESSDVLQAPADALDFAIAVLHLGIDTSELIQAYRVGQNIAWSWWMEHLATAVADHGLLREAIEFSSERMFAYVDAVVEEQVRLWGGERERWAGRLAVRRAEAVRLVLGGDVSAEATRAVGYSLERELVAGILWEQGPQDAGAASMDALELTAEAIAQEIGVQRTLVVPAAAACLWLWFATDDALGLDGLAYTVQRRLRPSQALALGLPAGGPEGFRASHRQALRTRRLAELSHTDTGVVRFDEVEMLCVMTEDPELLGEFVKRKLGALANADPSAERLRETVLAWLREGGNASRTAHRLGAHKNTVRYRVQRAEEIIGRPLAEDRLGLELALTMVQQIGPPRAVG
jgi:DNA-binding PucR family transcriptional regulator